MKTITLADLFGMTALAAAPGGTDRVDLVSLDAGGHVESTTSEGIDSVAAIRLIDGNPRTHWLSATDV